MGFCYPERMTIHIPRAILLAALPALALWTLLLPACTSRVAEVSADSGASASGEQPRNSETKEAAPAAGGKSEWPVSPEIGGDGADEAFLVTSITIDGLAPIGMSQRDVSNAAIEIEDRGRAWGRPMEKKARVGALLQPVSPLCLYKDELQRICKSVLLAINSKGFVGVFVYPDEPRHPADGAIRLLVRVTKIGEVQVEDHRVSKEPEADPDSIRKECPLKPGDYLNRERIDEFAKLLRGRFHADVDVAVSAQEGQEQGRVVLTIILGPQKAK